MTQTHDGAVRPAQGAAAAAPVDEPAQPYRIRGPPTPSGSRRPWWGWRR
ncbi:hypothetical protein ACFQY7_12015 [Actinomadura luteofluorescens]